MENNTATESCVIGQGNTTGHNIAIVIQIYTKPQTANQTANITQTNVGGSNLAAIVHIVKQSTQSAGTQMDDQEASISQTGDPSTFDTGRNLSILHQSSTQFGQSGTLDAQEQDSSEHGNVSQLRGGVSKAFADQSQSQTLKGHGGQTQHIDPRCCASQQSNLNDDFEIVQHASQFEENPTPASQDSSTIGECSSSGHCGIDQTASINGGTPVHLHKDCTATSCTSGIACNTASGCQPCTVVPNEEGPPTCVVNTGLLIGAAYSSNAPAIARVGASLASRVRAAQSAPSGALLT